MINKRLKFISELGMDKYDSFDINKISDKLKKRKIITESGDTLYEIVPENGHICVVEKDESGNIIEYKSDGGSHASIYNNGDYHILMGDIEEIYKTINETDKIYSKYINGILIDQYNEYTTESHVVETRGDMYTILYEYIDNDILYKVKIITSKDVYDELTVSNIKDMDPFGIWSINTFHLDGRPSSEFDNNLCYKRYYYSDSNLPIGSIEIDTHRDMITEVSVSSTGSVTINRSIITGEGILINEHGDKSFIKIEPSKQRGILFNDTTLNILSIDNSGSITRVSSNGISYDSVVNETSVINKYSNGVESIYVHLNRKDELLSITDRFKKNIYMYDGGTTSEYNSIPGIGTVNMGVIDKSHHTVTMVDGLPYSDYTSKEILNNGTMVIYRLHGIISQIDVFSTRGTNDVLKEHFIFALDGSMERIEQYYYNGNMLSMINII